MVALPPGGEILRYRFNPGLRFFGPVGQEHLPTRARGFLPAKVQDGHGPIGCLAARALVISYGMPVGFLGQPR